MADTQYIGTELARAVGRSHAKHEATPKNEVGVRSDLYWPILHAVREKLIQSGITEQDVEDAVQWARKQE